MTASGPPVAFVGWGHVAPRHAEVLRSLGAQPVAACTLTDAGRERARRDGGVARTYADPVEMIERERPAGIVVATPAMENYRVLERLIPCGVPVLAEKPPGTSLVETRRLAALAAESGTPVLVGLNRRFYSVLRRGLDALGGRDAVTRVAVEWSEDPAAMLEHGHPASLLPRLNFANSLHGLDLLTLLAGPVERHTTRGRDLDPAGDRLRWQMCLTGESRRGVAVQFDSTWDAPAGWRLRVDAPGAQLVSAPLETARIYRRAEPEELLEPDEADRRFKPGFHAQASAFLAVARDGATLAWPACSIQESVASVALAEALTAACSRAAPRGSGSRAGARQARGDRRP